MHITDLSRAETISFSSGGRHVTADRYESSPYRDEVHGGRDMAKTKGINALHIRCGPLAVGPRIPGPGAQRQLGL